MTIPDDIPVAGDETPQGLARIGREITRQASVIAYINAFGLFTLVASAAIPFALLFKNDGHRSRRRGRG